VSGLELVTATSASNSTTPKTQTVSCTGVKKALGGGGSISLVSDQVAIQDSEPTGGSLPTGWTVTAVANDILVPAWTVTASVICATVP